MIFVSHVGTTKQQQLYTSPEDIAAVIMNICITTCSL